MLSLLLAAALVTAQATTPAVQAPDTPAGRALTEFVDSFNAGGQARQTWVETRTTLAEASRGNILKMDAQVLQQYGPMSLLRVVSSTPEQVVAIVKHGKADAHGHLTIDVEPTAPNKVVNMRMRGATPEEVKGGAGK